MGERAKLYFAEAERLAGLVGKIRLASLAQVTSDDALTQDDTDEVTHKLEQALRRVRSEALAERSAADAAKPGAPVRGAIAAPSAGGSELGKVRRYMATFVQLTTQRGLFLRDPEATMRRVNEAAASALEVDRVSIWMIDRAKTKIRCVDLYERKTRTHSAGTELSRTDFKPYFVALESERTIAAHDANTDPRTSCFSASYLQPLGIGAMLDVPIWVEHEMVGVVCHEHIGLTRTWNADEESFAYLMSNLVAMSMERRSGAR